MTILGCAVVTIIKDYGQYKEYGKRNNRENIIIPELFST